MKEQYENHELEWREEENCKRYERELAKKSRYIHPHDPDYITLEEPDAE